MATGVIQEGAKSQQQQNQQGRGDNKDDNDEEDSDGEEAQEQEAGGAAGPDILVWKRERKDKMKEGEYEINQDVHR